MEPPEPLERVLAELPKLAQDEELLLLVRCEPLPLYAILAKNGFGYSSKLQADGSNEVRISKIQSRT